MTIRVFAACAPNHEDAESQAVLEWSLRKHASEPVELTWMKMSRNINSPFNSWDSSRWATPFTPFRWAVPELAGGYGKALYVDSDVIFMDDVAKLYHMPVKVVANRGGSRFCVALWNCEEAVKHIPPIEEMKRDPSIHNRMRGVFAPLAEAFDTRWNCLDGEERETLDDIGILHYTAMRHQPQLKYALPRLERAGIKHWFDGEPKPHFRQDVIDVFDKLLLEASDNGYPVEKYTRDEIYGDYQKRSVSQVGKPHWAGRFSP